jgi:hypothetical protein
MFKRMTANKKMKAGVSLVTVLLFMLVATIAATATYKWLTSEGRSSGARLQKQAAYQSAMAGIENARAWMTYNANDVGALIKQYKDNGKKIKLNSRLTPWSNADHNYDVWLVGVNTGSAHNFKLKVLSSGKANGGTVHNELAIFNVDGLYQIQVPSEEVGGATFDKAFDGKMTGITGNDTLQSGIIHGDFVDQNNTPKLSGNFIVSGDMGFGGTVKGDGDMYIKGSITSKNGGYTFGNDLKSVGMWGWVTDIPDTNVVYVGGDVDCADNQPIKVYGDLYVGGRIKERCAIDVSGNLTIGGGIDRTNTAAKRFTIGKNLVFKKDAEFNYTTTIGFGMGGTAGDGVGENTYLAKLLGQDKNGGRKVHFGKKIYLYENVTYKHCANRNKPSYWDPYGSYRPTNCSYCEGFYTECDESADYSIEDNRYFSIYNPLIYSGYGYYATYTYNSRVSNTRISEWSKNDEVLKDVGFNYWDNIEKMQGYGKIIKNDGTIPQAMLLKDSLSWINKAKENVAHCKMQKNWMTEPAHIKALNDCYKDAKKNHPEWLYGGFLPIEWEYNQDKDPGREKLDGNFLIYASKAVGNTTLPPTTATAIVMFYFEKGVNGQLKGKHDDRLNRDLVYNYFFYSNGDIKEIHGFNIKGSIVMSNGTTMQKYQGGNKVEFSSTVINALVNAGIIMENPEFTRLVNGTSSSSGEGTGSVGGAGGGGTDPYFIASSPQLRITLETQYENNEPLPSASEDESDEVEPSFMVLPRIIYLPKNPYGKLTDYFSVVPLNGAEVTKDFAKITECSGIPTSTLLFDRSNSSAEALSPGLHTCKYTDLSKTIPFYVFVYDNDIGNLPFVSFETDYEELGVGDEAQVKMVCPAGLSSQEFTVKVTKPNDLPDIWTIEREAGTTLEGPGSCSDTDAECTFKFNFSTDCASHKPLFKISTTATEGTAVFQMVCLTGCMTGSPSTERFVASSSVTINRAGLAEYCALSGVDCDESMRAMASRPDCAAEGTKSWVRAVGSGSTTNNCSITDPNEAWTCGVSSAIVLSGDDLDANVPAGCEVIIPSDEDHNKISNPQSSEAYTLYASLKAKLYDFTVSFAGEKLNGKQIQVYSERFTDSPKTCTYSSGSPSCTYQLYAGDKVEVVIPSSDRSDFSYWKCTPGTSNVNCPTDEPMTGTTYTIESVGGQNSVTAWFGQKDKHCFFDEFITSKACSDHTAVGDKMYCLSYCSTAGGAECTIANAASGAKWFVFGGQNERDNLLMYEDGKVWLKDSYVRGKKQSEVNSLKILSTQQAGLYGTLRAQFQIPQLGRGGNDATARVYNSGFMLRSDNAANSYLMLNVFADKNGKLAARACVGNVCREENLLSEMGMVSVQSTDIVTLSATIKAENRNDVLEIEVVVGNYGTYTTAKTRFDLSSIDGFLGLTTRGVNEYVGFVLSDPAFKVYDVGWKSDDYNATCWDTYPTVKCSFRVAYVGGIVPLGKPAKPWIGLSSWFDDKSCTPKYYYNGDDATSGCYGMESEGYKECYSPDYYKFSGEGASGLHGTTVGSVDTKMAMARIQDCDASYLSEDNRNLLYAESAKCGEFWVGDFTNCNKNVTFYSEALGRTLSKHSGATTPDNINSTPNELFALGSNTVANLRAANIRIILDNPNASEVEVYLRSTTTDGYGYYGAKQVLFSTSATTTANGVVNISVEDLANEVGFDVEHVNGVVIRNLGENDVTINEIRSTCDYVTSIQCKNLEYTGGKFKVNAVVKQAQNVSSYSITGKNENGETILTEKTWTCGNDGVDCPTGDNEGKIFLESEAYNPYENAFNTEKSYVFTVEMRDASGHVEGSPCTTSPVLKIQPISGECKWTSTNDKPSVQQGNGLPDFQYKLADCGGKTCAWEIYLDNVKIYEGTGTVGGFTSLPSEKKNEYNQNTDDPVKGKLSAGDHSIYFKNATGDDYAQFNECSKTFTVVEAGSGTGNLTCSMPAEFLKGKEHSRMTSIYSSLENQQFDLHFDNGAVVYTQWINNGNNNSWGDFTVPSTIGTHTYQITKKGKTEVECSGSFEIVEPLTCSVKNTPVELNAANEFTVTKHSSVNSCYECSYTGVNCGTQCNSGNLASYPFTVTSAGTKTLSVSCKCDGVSTSCSRTVGVDVATPTVGCSETPIAVGSGASVSFTPTSLTNCEVGCDYAISYGGSDVKTGSSYTSASAISFDGRAGAGENTYTFTVSNRNGETVQSASCDFVVDYKDPSVTCTDEYSVEPGASVPFTPTTLNYCGGGCKDTVKIGNTIVTGINTWDYTSPTAVSFTTRRVDNQETDTYVFKVTNQANRSGSCDITVNYLKPTVGCPAGMEKPASATVTVTPTSVSNCTQGCKYKVTKGSASGTTVISEPSDYSYTVAAGGTPGSLGDGFTGEAADDDSVHYYVTLSNPAGSTTCNFGVMYKSDEDLCHCTCGDCSNVRSETYSENRNGPGMFCFFIDNENVKLRMDTYTKEDDSPNTKPHCSVVINGVSLKKFSGTELKNLVTSKVDGGYYIYVGNDASAVTNTDFCSFQFETSHTSTTNHCSSGGGGSGGGGSGGGSGTDVELSSQGMDSYTKGTYTLKTGSGLGSGPVPRTFKCRTENIRPSTIRVVGTIYLGDEKKYDISISAYNDYSQGYDLNSETTYTFNVDNSIDNLECGLWF